MKAFVLMKNSKSVISKLCLNSVFKKAASHATVSFLLYMDKCEMKNVQPLLLFFADDSCLLSVYVLV